MTNFNYIEKLSCRVIKNSKTRRRRRHSQHKLAADPQNTFTNTNFAQEIL